MTKTCIVHTSNFSILKIHKICYASHTGLKFPRYLELLTIPLLHLQILDHYVFPITFYEPLNVQNQMCVLCIFANSVTYVKRFHSFIIHLMNSNTLAISVISNSLAANLFVVLVPKALLPL